MENSKMLYWGSCRYMYDFMWNSFAGRLHTTREIGSVIMGTGIDLINQFPQEYFTYVFGDIHNAIASNNVSCTTAGFERKLPDLKDIKDVIIEVSSNVVNKAYIKGRTVYVNTFYVNRDADNTIDSPGRVISREIRDASQVVILSPKDLELDLVLIRDLIKEKFHPEARLHVIPPLNLRTGGDNSNYIRTRVANTYALEAACNQYKINFYNVGKHLEDVCINPTLEKFQPTRAHYDEDLFAEYVRPYLEEQIKPL